MVKNVEKRVYTPCDLCVILGLGRVKVYEFLKAGRIPSIRLGNKYLIPVDAFETWLDSCGLNSVVKLNEGGEVKCCSILD